MIKATIEAGMTIGGTNHWRTARSPKLANSNFEFGDGLVPFA